MNQSGTHSKAELSTLYVDEHGCLMFKVETRECVRSVPVIGLAVVNASDNGVKILNTLRAPKPSWARLKAYLRARAIFIDKYRKYIEPHVEFIGVANRV
jgi:hypothetical protein